jgi:hypothetical protein
MVYRSSGRNFARAAFVWLTLVASTKQHTCRLEITGTGYWRLKLLDFILSFIFALKWRNHVKLMIILNI